MLRSKLFLSGRALQSFVASYSTTLATVSMKTQEFGLKKVTVRTSKRSSSPRMSTLMWFTEFQISKYHKKRINTINLKVVDSSEVYYFSGLGGLHLNPKMVTFTTT